MLLSTQPSFCLILPTGLIILVLIGVTAEQDHWIGVFWTGLRVSTEQGLEKTRTRIRSYLIGLVSKGSCKQKTDAGKLQRLSDFFRERHCLILSPDRHWYPLPAKMDGCSKPAPFLLGELHQAAQLPSGSRQNTSDQAKETNLCLWREYNNQAMHQRTYLWYRKLPTQTDKAGAIHPIPGSGELSESSQMNRGFT